MSFLPYLVWAVPALPFIIKSFRLYFYCFCALASLLEYASMNLLFGIIVPSDSVNKFSIPTSIPIDLDISNVSIDSFFGS